MNKYMEEAVSLSEKNKYGGPFGAVIVKDDKIVGKGTNRVLHDNDPTAHAEVTAIRNACKELGTYDLSGCTLYTSSYPCPMCLSAIIWANIKKVYYANTKEEVSEIGFRDEPIYEFIDKLSEDKKDNRVLNLKQINIEKAKEILHKYEENKDSIIY